MPQEYKVKAVEKLTEKLKVTKSFILADYRGLTVAEITELRSKLREKDTNFNVVKNNYFKIALKNTGFENVGDLVKGPIGVVFIESDDPVSPAKVLVDFEKEKKKTNTFKIVGGYSEGRAIDNKEIVALSKLPTKDVLLGQIMGTVQGPIRGIMTCMQGSLRGIMQCLKGLIDKNS